MLELSFGAKSTDIVTTTHIDGTLSKPLETIRSSNFDESRVVAFDKATDSWTLEPKLGTERYCAFFESESEDLKKKIFLLTFFLCLDNRGTIWFVRDLEHRKSCAYPRPRLPQPTCQPKEKVQPCISQRFHFLFWQQFLSSDALAANVVTPSYYIDVLHLNFDGLAFTLPPSGAILPPSPSAASVAPQPSTVSNVFVQSTPSDGGGLETIVILAIIVAIVCFCVSVVVAFLCGLKVYLNNQTKSLSNRSNTTRSNTSTARTEDSETNYTGNIETKKFYIF